MDYLFLADRPTAQSWKCHFTYFPYLCNAFKNIFEFEMKFHIPRCFKITLQIVLLKVRVELFTLKFHIHICHINDKLPELFLISCMLHISCLSILSRTYWCKKCRNIVNVCETSLLDCFVLLEHTWMLSYADTKRIDVTLEEFATAALLFLQYIKWLMYFLIKFLTVSFACHSLFNTLVTPATSTVCTSAHRVTYMVETT